MKGSADNIDEGTNNERNQIATKLIFKSYRYRCRRAVREVTSEKVAKTKSEQQNNQEKNRN